MKASVKNVVLLYAPLIVLAIVAIVFGSRFDWEISESMYSANSYFGLISALIAKLPGYSLIGFSGILFFLSKKNDSLKALRVISWIACFLFPFASGVLFGWDNIAGYLPNIVASMAIGVFVIGGIDGLLFLLFKDSKNDEFMSTAIVFCLAFALTFLLSYAVKVGGYRPRFKWILANGDSSYFRPWWSFDKAFADSFPDVAPDNFKSFPSGHATTSALAVLCYKITDAKTRKAWPARLTFYIGLVFAVAFSIGRIADGSHYLSDVGWGLLISALSMVTLECGMLYVPKNLPEVRTRGA